jgi:hypothetical protein
LFSAIVCLSLVLVSFTTRTVSQCLKLCMSVQGHARAALLPQVQTLSRFRTSSIWHLCASSLLYFLKYLSLTHL